MVRTLANTSRTTCTKMSQRSGATIHTDDGSYQVIRVTVKRPRPKQPLRAYVGGLS
jgi:hypothetical protein